jgi:hypothetical protein
MAQHITSGTTTGGTVSTITFTTWYKSIEIINRSTNDMWARVDSVDPTIAGDECFFVPGMSFIDVANPQRAPEPALATTPNTVVKILTATASNYTIQVGV